MTGLVFHLFLRMSIFRSRKAITSDSSPETEGLLSNSLRKGSIGIECDKICSKNELLNKKQI